MIRDLFRKVPRDSMAWISLGSLRMTAQQKKMIENRFPFNTILLAEMITAQDGKVRYHDLVREKLYSRMLELIREQAPRVPVYLCMEPAAMWERLGITMGGPWLI